MSVLDFPTNRPTAHNPNSRQLALATSALAAAVGALEHPQGASAVRAAGNRCLVAEEFLKSDSGRRSRAARETLAGLAVVGYVLASIGQLLAARGVAERYEQPEPGAADGVLSALKSDAREQLRLVEMHLAAWAEAAQS